MLLTCPGSKLPGYYHSVPPGRRRFEHEHEEDQSGFRPIGLASEATLHGAGRPFAVSPILPPLTP